MTKHVDAQQYADAYNDALTKGFEELQDKMEVGDPLAETNSYAEFRNLLMNRIQGWDDKPLESGETANEILEREAVSDDFWDFIYNISFLVDEDLPDQVKLTLSQRADETIDVFHRWIDEADWTESDDGVASEELQVAVMALKLLAQWEDLSEFPTWVERFSKIEKPAMLFSEAMIQYSATIPHLSLGVLMDFLENTDEDEMSLQGREYLLVALTEAAKSDALREELLWAGDQETYQKLQDRSYKILRRYFLDRDPRVIAAICLGDLGHPRGVALLRSYIIRHEHDVDRQLYYEILSSIKRLGGDIKDLPDPFKDFSNPGGGPWQSR